jgi:hypothetical protein
VLASSCGEGLGHAQRYMCIQGACFWLRLDWEGPLDVLVDVVFAQVYFISFRPVIFNDSCHFLSVAGQDSKPWRSEFRLPWEWRPKIRA